MRRKQIERHQTLREKILETIRDAILLRFQPVSAQMEASGPDSPQGDLPYPKAADTRIPLFVGCRYKTFLYLEAEDKNILLCAPDMRAIPLCRGRI